jgi:hypothetical protein
MRRTFQHMNGELFPPKNVEVSDNLVAKFHGEYTRL